MNTLYLDPATGDLTTDASGNIAMATNPYALAQDAASAIELFSGELWYDTTQGLPYFPEILGRPPPIALMRSTMVAAALAVPEVTAAAVFFGPFVDRVMGGQVQVTGPDGTKQVAPIGFPVVHPRGLVDAYGNPITDGYGRQLQQ